MVNALKLYKHEENAYVSYLVTYLGWMYCTRYSHRFFQALVAVVYESSRHGEVNDALARRGKKV